MLEPIPVDELVRMFKAGHVWTCEKCAGAIDRYGLCSCGAVNIDAYVAFVAAYKLEAEKKAEAAERRRSSRVAAKALKAGTAEPMPVLPLDSQRPKRSKSSKTTELLAEKTTVKTPSVFPCPVCGTLLMKDQPCLTCALSFRATIQGFEQPKQTIEESRLEVEAQQVEAKWMPKQPQAALEVSAIFEKNLLGSWMILGVLGVVVIPIIWGMISLSLYIVKKPEPTPKAPIVEYQSLREIETARAEQGIVECAIERNGGLTQKIITYEIGGVIYAINGQARQRVNQRSWIDGKKVFTPDEMQAHLKDGLRKCADVSPASPTSSTGNLLQLEQEGSRDGASFANELRKIGEIADGISCALGMAAVDERRSDLSQAEAEIYAKAFGNACVGRKIL